MIANPNDGNSPRVEAATPIIDVSAEGLITATTEQEAGYVAGGSKSATQQLPTQGAATIMPGTTDQTAVASGRYTTGDVKVAGDANLKAENIAEGVSIFGVQGTHSGGGGGYEWVNFRYETAPPQFVYIVTNYNDTPVFESAALMFHDYPVLLGSLVAILPGYVKSITNAEKATGPGSYYDYYKITGDCFVTFRGSN